VGRHTEGLTTDVDLLAVGLVDNIVDELDVVGVGDDLVVGDDVLETSVSEKWPAKDYAACRTELAGAQHLRSRQIERAARSHAAARETHLEDDHVGGYGGVWRKCEV
jgi:hypothetical protein